MDFYSGIKDSENVQYGRDEVFKMLEIMKVEQAVVSFSGGHDEGGADRIVLRRSGEELTELREHIFPYEQDEEGNDIYDEHKVDGRYGVRVVKRPRQRELTGNEKAEMQLAQSLSAPVYDQYHSFAGEYSVSGEVVWEVEDRRVYMSGDETVESYEDIGREL